MATKFVHMHGVKVSVGDKITVECLEDSTLKEGWVASAQYTPLANGGCELFLSSHPDSGEFNLGSVRNELYRLVEHTPMS